MPPLSATKHATFSDSAQMTSLLLEYNSYINIDVKPYVSMSTEWYIKQKLDLGKKNIRKDHLFRLCERNKRDISSKITSGEVEIAPEVT